MPKGKGYKNCIQVTNGVEAPSEQFCNVTYCVVADYSCVFLPWGPKWTAVQVRHLMYTKDLILNSQWYDEDKSAHTHPCFFGTISYKYAVAKSCGQKLRRVFISLHRGKTDLWLPRKEGQK